MVNIWVENGVPQGQILKSRKPYCVVPHMKALHKCFSDQFQFWRYDVIWWRNDVKSFLRRNKCTCSPPKSMHAWMGGDLSQCVPEWGESFCKILLVHWATWFFFFVLSLVFREFPHSTSLTSIYHLLYICSSKTVNSLMPPFQGHVMVKVGCERNLYFLHRQWWRLHISEKFLSGTYNQSIIIFFE
jgi:hypothetical protein